MTDTYDVAVIGFGPGGEVLASLLGQTGHRVVVFEKFPAPYGLPRMSTLDGEIARILQHAGDPAKAMEGTIPQPCFLFTGADGELALEADWRFAIGGQPARLSLHQPNIEAAMQERIDSCANVDIRWGTEVTGLEEVDDAVHITACTRGTDGQATSEQSVRASYVVGMDGASSFVRKTLGIELEVLRTHDDRWFLTDFDIVDPDLEPPVTTVGMRPEGPYFWGPNGARRCRTDVRVMGGVDPGDLVDQEHGYQWLEDNMGITRDQVRITRRVQYRFLSQYATSFRKGRIFIGGDAAHAMTPFMGQGSCTAMRDGINLAWKLDVVLRGHAAATLLDSYEPERMPQAVAVVHGSLGAYLMISEEDPEKAAGRDAYLRSGQAEVPAVPPLSEGILHRDAEGAIVAPVGSVAPQGRVRLDGREGLLDDLIGFGFQLITSERLDDVLDDARTRTVDELGIKVLTLGDGDDAVHDLENVYHDFLTAHGSTALLARPDFYLFGLANGPEETAALLDELADQLAGTAVPAA